MAKLFSLPPSLFPLPLSCPPVCVQSCCLPAALRQWGCWQRTVEGSASVCKFARGCHLPAAPALSSHPASCSHAGSSSPQRAVQWHQAAWGSLPGHSARAHDKMLLWAGTCTVAGDTGLCCGAVGCCSVTSPLKCSCPTPVPRTVYLLLCGVQSGNDPAGTGLCSICTPNRFYFKLRKNAYKLVGLGEGCDNRLCAGPWASAQGEGPRRTQASNNSGMAFGE